MQTRASYSNDIEPRSVHMRRVAFSGLSVLVLVACQSASAGSDGWPKSPEPPPYPPVATHEAGEPRSNVATRSTSVSDPDPSGPPSASPLASQYSGHTARRVLKGTATYYSDALAGRHTASGEPYRPEAFTAAHRSLAFGTILRVVRTDTARVTYVRVNDRGPFGEAARVIDLSRAAAEELDMLRAGVVPVKVEVLDAPAD